MDYSDTIISLCSGPIKAAVSMIRISGSDAFELTRKVFSNKSDYEHQKVYYGFIKDNGETLDEVMATFYRGPKSFSGEDMVEITCHGNLLIVNNIIQLFIKNGARLAKRGEFTERAFLNGRIDLISAEAVNDIVNATSNKSISLALNGLKGSTSKLVYELSDELLDIISQINVNIDYPEYDDIEQLTKDSILPQVNNYILKIDKIIEDTKKGQKIKNGIDTVIIGRPNVGKSSLLNALIREDKAIVTDIAGTTRDIVEGKIEIGGVTLNLIDTAGIHESTDFIEKIGIEKSLNSLKKANLVLLVLDNSAPLTEEDIYLLNETKDYPRIILLNKSDAGHNIQIDEGIEISAFNKDIDKLEEKIEEMFAYLSYDNEPMLFNARQEGLLRQAKEHLLEAKKQCEDGQVVDLISIDITQAYNCILEILGKVNKENLLDNIFSKFCLGK